MQRVQGNLQMFSLIPEHVGITLFEMGKNSLIFLISFSVENFRKNLENKYCNEILSFDPKFIKALSTYKRDEKGFYCLYNDNIITSFYKMIWISRKSFRLQWVFFRNNQMVDILVFSVA